MKLRKSLLCVLALVMMLGLLCVTAFATEMQTTPGKNREVIPFRVNPAYEDIYQAEDLAPLLAAAEEEGKVSQQMPALQTGDTAYLPMEQAALQLRQQMKNRQGYVEVYISSTNKDYNALIAQTVDIALLHTGDPVEGDYLRWHFGGWEGEVEWNQEGDTYLYKYELMMLYYTTAEQEQELNGAVDSLLASLNLDGKSDYEKVCAVYEYICETVTYDNEHLYDINYTLKNSAYAALINKTAICQGYANLFYRLMLEMGIDSRLIAGDANGPHAWNIVKLGDVYYNLDSTWDAGFGPREYFLQNSEGFADHYRYMDYATTQFHTDYPMSATDYVDGVAGEPENVYVAGICGDDAYWSLGRDRVLTIVGSGETYNYVYGIDGATRPEWEWWKDSFDTVVVEEGITVLGTNLFNGYQTIVRVDLPAGLKRIESQAFANCQNLSQLTLREGLEEIGSDAFHYSALEEVTLPSTMKTVNGFRENLQLKTVTILAEEVAFGDGAFNRCESLKNFQLPAKTTWIGQDAFAYCYSLNNVTIPQTVTGIGTKAFTFCKSLENVVINSHCELGFGAFSDCQMLKCVIINGDCDIGTDAFFECRNLETVELNGETKMIWMDAFTHCESLKEITIPESVEHLMSQCFRYCTGLEKIIFTGDEPIVDYYAFDHVTATAYYPMNNPTWDEVLQQELAGNVTWEAYCDHDYTSTSTMASCIHNNETVYTCTKCGHSYAEIFRYATGQHTFTDAEDTVCDVCGGTRDLNMPTTPMYRLYNMNSGEHFYTGSVEERDVLISVGWQYEGIAWNAPTKYGAPVYRLYNPNNGDHHYTMSTQERDMLASIGWQYEGVAWNSASPSNLPMYRLYNPNADCGSHHYTGSKEEREFLVSLGWHYEGIGWYGMLN